MGWCHVGNKWIQNVDKQHCEENLKGQYSEEGPLADKKKDGNGCTSTLLTRALADNMFALGTTYQSQVDFRDHILQSTAFGRRMIRLYYQYNPTMLSILSGNTVLLGQAIRAWANILRFIDAVI